MMRGGYECIVKEMRGGALPNCLRQSVVTVGGRGGGNYVSDNKQMTWQSVVTVGGRGGGNYVSDYCTLIKNTVTSDEENIEFLTHYDLI
ncbi:hypothetical protein J6590_007669 [Homalodisca vitripennis]|nr:hypothetical protein J6590_007669 [Homalodisca vitripennis]